MAYDKVVDSAKLDSEMKATADAIRSACGQVDVIAWENGYGFAKGVEQAHGKGFEQGFFKGKETGYADGHADAESADAIEDAVLLEEINAAIVDAAKNPTSCAETLSDLPESVGKLYDQGYGHGEYAGYEKGKAEGKAEGEQIGRDAAQAEDAIEDAALLNGINAAISATGADAAEKLDTVAERITEVYNNGYAAGKGSYINGEEIAF